MPKKRKAKKRVIKSRRSAVHGRHQKRKTKKHNQGKKKMLQNQTKEITPMTASIRERVQAAMQDAQQEDESNSTGEVITENSPVISGNTPMVAMNGQMEGTQAAETLGCSYSHLINLIKAKKIKAQKKDRRWLVDADDVYRAKNTGMVRPRKNGKVKSVPVVLNKARVDDTEMSTGPTVKLQLEVDKNKLELVRLAFHGKDQNLVSYLKKQIDDLYNKVQDKLASVKFD